MSSKIADARRATAGGIKYKLISGPKLSGDAEGLTATEQYLIRTVDVDNFFAESFPSPIIMNSQLVFPAKRRMPGSGLLVTKSIDFDPHAGTIPGDPFATDTGAPAKTYDDLYVATIKYETMQESEDNEPDPLKPETFLEHTVDVGGEFLHWSPKKTKIKDPTAATGTSAATPVTNTDQQLSAVKVIPTIEHSLKWSRALRPPWLIIRQALGRINVARHPFFNNAPIGTVMFMGVSGSQKYLWDSLNGVRLSSWTLDFKFSEKAVTENAEFFGIAVEPFYYSWNHVFVPSKGKWMELQNVDGLPLHQSGDFLQLFQNEPVA